MATVKLKNLEKTYENGHLAVQGINLEIHDGEFMVFVGPSGCAKSTTLRMIAGLESISSGEVVINDKVMNDVAPKDRGIAMVFQNYALYPHYTVYENMAFGLKLAKVPKDEIKKRVEEAAELLELKDYLNKKPKEMSGGQRQRVAVGRAIVRHPDVFLFDEPLSNLDAKLRVHMRVQITQLHQNLKEIGKPATMIYVTHDQVEAMTMGDRICVLNYGKIMQVDTPINLYNSPANKFVANFIGSPSMNLIKGELLIENTNVYILINNQKFLLPSEKGAKLQNNNHRKIWFGLRPEHVSTKKDSDFSHPIEGEISIIEQMGNESYIYFTSFEDEQLISRIPSSVKYQNGSKQVFYLDFSKCHIFDFITENNISL